MIPFSCIRQTFWRHSWLGRFLLCHSFKGWPVSMALILLLFFRITTTLSGNTAVIPLDRQVHAEVSLSYFQFRGPTSVKNGGWFRWGTGSKYRWEVIFLLYNNEISFSASRIFGGCLVDSLYCSHSFLFPCFFSFNNTNIIRVFCIIYHSLLPEGHLDGAGNSVKPLE